MSCGGRARSADPQDDRGVLVTGPGEQGTERHHGLPRGDYKTVTDVEYAKPPVRAALAGLTGGFLL